MENRDPKGRYLTGTEPGPGRSCGYDTAMDEQVFKLALLGLTDAEMAKFFDVSRNTFHRWKAEYPGFRDAVHRGKESADAEVALALFKRAAGMSVKSEKAMKGQDGEIVITQTVTEIPPDTKAAIHWLQLRRRNTWNGSVLDDTENSTKCAKCAEVASLSDEELENRLKIFKERRKIERTTQSMHPPDTCGMLIRRRQDSPYHAVPRFAREAGDPKRYREEGNIHAHTRE